ncbi:MAG: P1 family peptidase [Deltaproteobacteria bacterium]|jgi:L-aminopeptidase/D-esterase-like protein|nr:P1 family peptidase [Deltaproteobacteria bacterium]
MAFKKITITSIEGLTVGHKVDEKAKTGCTALLAPKRVKAACFNPGFAPGSRETDLLNPKNSFAAIHGLCLAGGSAFGLAAAGGVVRFLRENGFGLDLDVIKIPLVPAAVIFDYPLNLSQGTLPDELMGYQAAQAASSSPVRSGPFGVGYSARSGKLGGLDGSSPSGLGSFGLEVNKVKMAALAAVNPFGSVIDPLTGKVLSGFKIGRGQKGQIAPREKIFQTLLSYAQDEPGPTNTVLIILATDAFLSPLDLHRLAIMASAGIARSIYPAFTPYDGDFVFALTTDDSPAKNIDLTWLGALAQDVVSQAIVNSVPK